MKKIFLPLLAALGMVVGMTLTSCGSGAGADDDSIAGMIVQSGSGVPTFVMTVGEQRGESSQYATEYTFGRSVYSGTFSVTDGYPIKDGDAIIIKGQMGIDDTSCLSDSEFMAWISGKSDSLSVQITSPIDITIKVLPNDSGTMTREVTGLFYYKVDASFPLETPVTYDGLYINANRLRKAFGIDDK